jgi:hypothetical protein
MDEVDQRKKQKERAQSKNSDTLSIKLLVAMKRRQIKTIIAYIQRPECVTVRKKY